MRRVPPAGIFRNRKGAKEGVFLLIKLPGIRATGFEGLSWQSAKSQA